MPTNHAAVLIAEKARPLQIQESPYPETLSDNELLIRNHALAMNPVDMAIQAFAIFPLAYPHVLGIDVAGEVVAVGEGGAAAARFKPGDRVLGHALGFDSRRREEAAFQEYTVLQAHMAAPIPDGLAYERAAVVPLCLSTAASGLFQTDYLALDHPKVAAPSNGKTLLVWSAASSVGCNAVQLARAAGYDVVATASPKNFDLVKSLGASAVVDYKSPSVVAELVDAFAGCVCAGAFQAAGTYADAITACGEVLAKVQGEGGKFIACAGLLPEDAKFPEGVSAKFIWGSHLARNEVAKAVYVDFLPEALAAGKYQAAPDPLVVGKGLEKVQEALDVLSGGLSAQKAVVVL